jgi:hypothetical protein
MIARLDHKLLMVACGFCPFSGKPIDPPEGASFDREPRQ